MKPGKRPRAAVIGQAPSQKSDPDKPWSSGPSFKRLLRWFGARSREELLEEGLLLENVSRKPPGPKGGKKGDPRPPEEELEKGRERVKKLLRTEGVKKVVLVGKIAAEALLPGEEFGTLEVTAKDGVAYVLIPHPSGANVSANGADGAVAEFLKTFLELGGS